MKKFKLSRKTYLIAFVFVMILNIGLAVFLINNVFAQTSDDKWKNQSQIVAEVLEQKDSPLLITIINVDNSVELFQTVNYTIQNISKKPIRAYTLVGGKIITSSFMTKLFQPQETDLGDLAQERANIKPGEKLLLSIDYVDFSDGSSWGEDKYQTSEQLDQERAGRKAAIQYLRSILEKDGQSALVNFLEQNILDLQVPMPDSNMSEQSKRGFRAGYKSVVSFAQENKNQESKVLVKKFSEMEKVIDGEEQRK